MKYVKVPLKILWKRFSRTMMNACFSIACSGLVYIALIKHPQGSFGPAVLLVWNGWFAGTMYSAWWCERFHDKEWHRKMLDEEFEKAVAIHSAEQIVAGDEEWKK